LSVDNLGKGITGCPLPDKEEWGCQGEVEVGCILFQVLGNERPERFLLMLSRE